MWYSITLLFGLTTANIQFLPKTEVDYDLNMAMDGFYFSAAAYCSKESILAWNCGDACQKHPDFEVIAVYEYSLYNEDN